MRATLAALVFSALTSVSVSAWDPLSEAGGMIVIGEKFWKVMRSNMAAYTEANAPRIHALPEGASSPQELSRWSDPRGDTRVLMLDKTPLARFTVWRCTGGTYKGKGKYLSNVTVTSEAIAGSGWRLSLDTVVSGPYNVGSREPVAALTLIVNYQAQRFFQSDRTGTFVFNLRGDGPFELLNGPPLDDLGRHQVKTTQGTASPTILERLPTGRAQDLGLPAEQNVKTPWRWE